MSVAQNDAALRRFSDVLGALLLLLLLAPLMLAIALLVRVTSRGPVLFVQQRVGRGQRPFGIVKFRTMRSGAASEGPQITAAGDPRITRVGRVLRRAKLDELPQLWNVLRGDMSFVGPRPEVAAYVADLTPSQRVVLAVRPGITDPASLAFRDEEDLLASCADPERTYRDEILPRKLQLSAAYLERRTLRSDAGVIARTVWSVLFAARAARPAVAAVAETPSAAAPPSPDLRRQVLAGVKWSAVAFYGDSVFRLAISVVLARLLSPTEFGLFALATSVVGILALVQESGLSAALVQHRGPIDAAATAALYLTSAAGVVLATATWFAAPWVAGFLEQPDMAAVLAPLSLLFLLHGFAHAPRALLQREMSFRPQALVQIIGTAVYGSVAGVMAVAGYGVWSLVIACLAAEVALTGGLWMACPWRPRSARFDVRVARDLGAFGRHILGANVLALLRDKLPVLVLGKLVGADLVGLFWLAQRWAALPIEGVTFVVSRVSYPAFARLRHEVDRIANGYALALQVILLVAVPAAFGLLLVAKPLIGALYDSRWQGAAPLLGILAFYGLFHAIASSTGEVFKALGKPRLVLVYALVYTVLLAVLLLVLGRAFGITGMALAVTLSAGVVAGLTLGSACVLLGLAFGSIVRLASLPLLGVAVMSAVVLLFGSVASLVQPPQWLYLVATATMGALAYLAVIALRRPDWVAVVRTRVRGRDAAPPAPATEQAA